MSDAVIVAAAFGAVAGGLAVLGALVELVARLLGWSPER